MPERPIRVLHCLPDLRVGGVGRLVLKHIAAFDPHRVESHVVVFGGRDDLRPQLEALGVKPVVLGHTGGLAGVSSTWRLARAARAVGADLLHTHLMLDRVYGAVVARALGLPTVTTLHWSTPVRSGNVVGAILREQAMACAAALSHARLIAVSHAVEEHARRELSPWPVRPITVVPSGVEVPAVEALPSLRAAGRMRMAVDEDTRVLLTLGRLIPGKGHDVAVEALAQLERSGRRGLKLVVVGHGDDAPRLRELVERAGLTTSVVLMGQQDRVGELLAGADVFLFPSATEGLPVALLEACAHGLAVVASSIAPVAEVVRDGETALLLGARDGPTCARAVSELLDHPDRARALGAAARLRIESAFSLASSTEALTRIYEAEAAMPSRAWGRT